MARDFDGANDNLQMGSDPTVDGYVTQSIALWVQNDIATTGTQWFVFGKDRFINAWGLGQSGSPNNNIQFIHNWSGDAATWEATSATMGTGIRHVVVTYDGGATTNDALIYFNNVSQTITEIVPPSGTLTADATQTLRAGETGANGADFNGRIGWLNYFNGTFTADDRNRARWWGKARGDVQVYHPFVTTKLANEGSAVADATAAGTTVTNSGLVVPVVRPGSALLGLGVGW